MNSKPKWANNESLLIEIAQNFKLLEEENMELRERLKKKQESRYSQKEQLKILKLYSYSSWSDYMKWIDEKLAESGESIDENEPSSIKRVLSEILEEPDFSETESLQRTLKTEEDKQNAESEVQLLAIENGKLRRENIRLKSKLTEIRALYSNDFRF